MKIQPGKRVQNMINGLIELKEEFIQENHPACFRGVLLDIQAAIKALNKVEKSIHG